jgi:hypothetical protein
MFGFGYSADIFYPEDLLDEYRNVSVPGGTVRVNKYRCSRKEYGGTADAEEIKDGFIGASNSRIIQEAGGPRSYVGVFVGKGSVEKIGRVLTAVHAYKDAFVSKYSKAGGHRGSCAALLARYRPDQSAQMLQAFCDAYIGLDCNGFVGNYAQRVNSKLGPDHTPKQYYEHRESRRTTIDDVVNLDVIVWENFTHIAIIDSFADLKTVRIVQSTGGGPQMTEHGLKPVGKGLFLIQPPTKVGGTVYVISNGF